MKVTIMRGHSGSGKTTKAIEIKNNSDVETVIVSADDYFTDKKGRYKFNHTLLSMAHEECYNKFVQALEQGKNVIVDNTNTLSWEFDKYITYCEENNHNYEFVFCNGNYTSVHNVPLEVIERQKRSLAISLSVNSFMNLYE